MVQQYPREFLLLADTYIGLLAPSLLARQKYVVPSRVGAPKPHPCLKILYSPPLVMVFMSLSVVSYLGVWCTDTISKPKHK